MNLLYKQKNIVSIFECTVLDQEREYVDVYTFAEIFLIQVDRGSEKFLAKVFSCSTRA